MSNYFCYGCAGRIRRSQRGIRCILCRNWFHSDPQMHCIVDENLSHVVDDSGASTFRCHYCTIEPGSDVSDDTSEPGSIVQ